MDVLAQKVHMYLEQKSAAPASDLEQKSIVFELKAADDETNVIEGYASTFGGEPDTVGDIVAIGAFTNTIVERGQEVKFLFAHDWYQIIGKVIDLKEDNYGLYFKAKISATARGLEIMTLVKDGVLDRISMGYRTKRAEWDNERMTRTILEADLYEISVVPIPANDRAVITGAKDNMPLPEPEQKAGRVLSAKTEKALREAFTALQDASDAMKIAQKEVEDVLALVDNPDDAASKVYDLPKGSDNELTVDDEQKALQAAEQERKQNEKLIELIEAMRKETAQLNSTN